jgi:hypothetical protein
MTDQPQPYATQPTPDSDQALREVLAKAVRPVLADWQLEEQTDALVDVLAAVTHKGYSLQALHDILVELDSGDLDPLQAHFRRGITAPN